MKGRPVAIWLAAVLVLSGGCRGFRHAVTRKYYINHEFSKRRACASVERKRFQFSNDDLSEARLWGPAISGRVEVYYSRGLDARAGDVAEKMNAIIEATEKRIGIEITYRLRLYLMRVNVLPQRIDFRLTFDYNEKVFAAPLFVEAGDDDGDLSKWPFPAYPFTLMHELTEMSLVDNDRQNPVLPDIGWRGLLIVNKTRWFREGLANYAGWVAADVAENQMGLTVWDDRLQCGVGHGAPFIGLVSTGRDLFEWAQVSSSDEGRLYSASLGLFLLIKERYGEEKIREITRRVEDLEWADGPSIIAVCNEVLDTDIVELAERFSLPRVWLALQRIGPAMAANAALPEGGWRVKSFKKGGPVDKSGIAPGDVITAVDGRPHCTQNDMEFALFRAMPDGQLRMTVWSYGVEREVSLSLSGVPVATPQDVRKARRQQRQGGKKEKDLWRGGFYSLYW